MPVFTGTTGNDILTGTTGDDEIYGNGGVDTIDAGDGNDLVVLRAQLNAPPNSVGIISGGAGIDTLRIDRAYAPYNNTMGPNGPYSFNTLSLFQTATTSISGFERLQFGSQAGDVMNVSLLFGGAAGQTNQIGPGLTADATLIGGAGLDTLTLSYNASVAGGVVTAPSFTYSNWDTVARAYLGGDRVSVGITGANGATLNGSAHVGVQGLTGGAGSDTINGSNDMDLISGGSGGTDFLYGNGGDDTFQLINTYVIAPGSGTIGAESTRTGVNTLFDGGSGFDFLQLGGNVNFQGTLLNIEGLYLTPSYTNPNLGNGTPVGVAFASQYYTVATFTRTGLATLPANLTVAGQGTVVVNFSDTGQEFDGSGYVFEGDDVFFTFNGGLGNDYLVGTGKDDDISGGGGGDEIHGGFGDDTFHLLSGTDQAFGDDGDDTFQFGTGTNASTVNGGAGLDLLQVVGNAGANTILTGSLSNLEAIYLANSANLITSAANLNNGLAIGGVIYGDFGTSITAYFAASDSSFYASNWATSGSFVFGVQGNVNDDAIKGATGQINFLFGNGGADQIRGGALGDTINGGDGDDKLIGGNGKDTLTGGAGTDTFRFNFATNTGTGSNADVITDFVIGTDKLGFGALDADLVAPGRQALTYIGNTAFHATGTAEVRFADSSGNLVVQVDLDGNGTSDMEVVLQGLAGQSMTAGDFLL